MKPATVLIGCGKSPRGRFLSPSMECGEISARQPEAARLEAAGLWVAYRVRLA
jgi:hypothetical protein